MTDETRLCDFCNKPYHLPGRPCEWSDVADNIRRLREEHDGWKRRAEASESFETVKLMEVSKALDDAREELARQVKIKMMMSNGRELFRRALQGIASEPCASRLVSGQECDPKEFPCARCKARTALREEETLR